MGHRVQVSWLSGNEFATQNGTFTCVEHYRELYKPYHKKLDDWVHANTPVENLVAMYQTVKEFQKENVK